MQLRPNAALTPLNHALRCALFGAALGLAAAPSLLHAAEPNGSASVQRYSIAAGPLADALNQFARTAGINLAATPQQTAGKQSPGLQGEYSAHDGLNQLLRGTDLEALNQGNGSFILSERLDAAGAMELGATAISSTGLGGTTEGSGSYTTGAVSIGKSPQSLRRTPQSVSVLTEQRLKDQNLTNLTQMLDQTPGVVVEYFDSERVQYYSRGFQIDAIQFDGATVVQGSGGGSYIQSDAAMVDHIETLRGATGMLRGSGNPSGTVNIVRKRPTRDFQASASVTAGSWDAQRYVTDLSGPLVEGGAIRARLIAVHDDKDFFQKSRMERKNALYAVLSADLGERTTITGGLEYTDLEANGAWGGLPADFNGKPLDLDRNTYLGATWNRWDRSNLQTFSELEHLFDNDWKLKLSATRTHFELDDNGFKQTYISRTPGSTNPYLMNVQVTEGDGGESKQTNLSAVLNGPFSLFGREHELVTGIERIRNDSYASATAGRTNLIPGGIDVRYWDPRSVLAEPDITITATPVMTRTTQEAAHATWRISLADPLTAIVGARMNWWDYEQPATPANDYSIDNEITPYAALIYDLDQHHSLYGSYTEIFSPQNVQNQSGSLLDPITGEAYEAGIKGEYYDGRLNASFALFRINQVGKALDDPDATGGVQSCPPSYPTGYCKVAGGKSRSEGFEIELSGEVLPDWQLSAGYTYTKTKYLKDTLSNTGNVLRSTDPKQMLKLFTSYRLPGQYAAWTVGGGMQAQSDIYSRSGSAEASQGGYAIYNAMLGYRFNDHYSLQFNANNIFDKYYYKKIGTSATSYYWGEPRNFAVTLRGEF